MIPDVPTNFPLIGESIIDRLPKSIRVQLLTTRKVPHIFWCQLGKCWRMLHSNRPDFLHDDDEVLSYTQQLNRTKQAHPILPEGDS